MIWVKQVVHQEPLVAAWMKALELSLEEGNWSNPKIASQPDVTCSTGPSLKLEYCTLFLHLRKEGREEEGIEWGKEKELETWKSLRPCWTLWSQWSWQSPQQEVRKCSCFLIAHICCPTLTPTWRRNFISKDLHRLGEEICWMLRVLEHPCPYSNLIKGFIQTHSVRNIFGLFTFPRETKPINFQFHMSLVALSKYNLISPDSASAPKQDTPAQGPQALGLLLRRCSAQDTINPNGSSSPHPWSQSTTYSLPSARTIVSCFFKLL